MSKQLPQELPPEHFISRQEVREHEPLLPGSGGPLGTGEAAPLGRCIKEPSSTERFYGVWSDGLCSCTSDPASCLCAIFCWDIFFVWRTWSIIDKSIWINVPIFGRQGNGKTARVVGCLVVLVLLDWFFYYELYGFFNRMRDVPGWLCAAVAFGSICFSLVRACIHFAVVDRFHMGESICISCFHIVFCGCCSILRMGRHVDRFDEVCNLGMARHPAPVTVGAPVQVAS